MKKMILYLFLLLAISCSLPKTVPQAQNQNKQDSTDQSKEQIDPTNHAEHKGQLSDHNTRKLTPSHSDLKTSDESLKITFLKRPLLTPNLSKYFDQVHRKFDQYNWPRLPIEKLPWRYVRRSHFGFPIAWLHFGPEVLERTQEERKELKTTLVLCTVHPDEITPTKFCFDLIFSLEGMSLPKNHVIVIAPIVTPDGFFIPKPTRTNARGVDVNRNFPTKDWNADALRLWRTKYRSSKRRYPGKKPLSEQETIFQVNLIKLYKPDKILSVHAPLTLIDYDGPTLEHERGQSGNQLLKKMSELAGNYKVKDYPFFPGSLGNWAGHELNIPTFTIELPNSDWNKTDRYFDLFSKAMHHALNVSK